MKALRQAIVTLLDTDATVVGITGRASDNLVTWSDIGTLRDVGIAYLIVTEPQTGEDNDTRAIVVQFSCFGLRLAQAEDLADRIEAVLTATALDAQGVNAAPMRVNRQEQSGLEDAARKMKRIDLEIEFNTIKG